MGASENWMSLRAYGRHRRVALSAVQKAIDSGRVTAIRRNAEGRLTGIEQIQADAQWLANTDPVESARTSNTLQVGGGQQPIAAAAGELPLGSHEVPRAEDPVPPAAEAAGGAAASEQAAKDFGYLEARAKTERFRSQQAELDYLEAVGQLVPTAELREAAHRRYRAIRDKLLNIPDRLAAILAAERDPTVVHTTLAKEIKQVLHELSDDARAEAARGAAVSVAA